MPADVSHLYLVLSLFNISKYRVRYFKAFKKNLFQSFLVTNYNQEVDMNAASVQPHRAASMSVDKGGLEVYSMSLRKKLYQALAAQATLVKGSIQ